MTSSSSRRPRGRHSRALLLGVIVLASLVAALTAAIIMSAAGASLSGILAASGVTFGAGMTIGFATCQFLSL